MIAIRNEIYNDFISSFELGEMLQKYKEPYIITDECKREITEFIGYYNNINNTKFEIDSFENMTFKGYEKDVTLIINEIQECIDYRHLPFDNDLKTVLSRIFTINTSPEILVKFGNNDEVVIHLNKKYLNTRLHRIDKIRLKNQISDEFLDATGNSDLNTYKLFNERIRGSLNITEFFITGKSHTNVFLDYQMNGTMKNSIKSILELDDMVGMGDILQGSEIKYRIKIRNNILEVELYSYSLKKRLTSKTPVYSVIYMDLQKLMSFKYKGIKMSHAIKEHNLDEVEFLCSCFNKMYKTQFRAEDNCDGSIQITDDVLDVLNKVNFKITESKIMIQHKGGKF